MKLQSTTSFMRNIPLGRAMFVLCTIALILPMFANAQKKEDLMLPELRADKIVVMPGQSTNLTWKHLGQVTPVKCEGTGFNTKGEIDGNFQTFGFPANPPNVKFTLTCTDANGNTETDSITIAVRSTFGTIGGYLKAYPKAVERLYATNLRYQMENVLQCNGNNFTLQQPFSNPYVGDQLEHPAKDMTGPDAYAMTCNNISGEQTFTPKAEVCLLPEVEITSGFTVNANNEIEVPYGQYIRFNYHYQNATTCKAENFNHNYNAASDPNVIGTWLPYNPINKNKYGEDVAWSIYDFGNIYKNTEYKLKCWNKCGYNYANLKVKVIGGPSGPGGNNNTGGENLIPGTGKTGKAAAYDALADAGLVLFNPNQDLAITSHTKNTTISGPTVRVSGTCDTGSPVFGKVTGSKMYRVNCDSSGMFAMDIDVATLKPGKKIIMVGQKLTTRKIKAVLVNLVKAGTAQASRDGERPAVVGRSFCGQDPKDINITGTFTADNYYHAVKSSNNFNEFIDVNNYIESDITPKGKGGFQVPETATFMLGKDQRVYVVHWEDGKANEGFMSQFEANGKTVFSSANSWEYVITDIPKPADNQDVDLVTIKNELQKNLNWKPAVELTQNYGQPVFKNGWKWPIVPGISKYAFWLETAPKDEALFDGITVPSVITLFRTAYTGSDVIDCDPEYPLPVVDIKANGQDNTILVNKNDNYTISWDTKNVKNCSVNYTIQPPNGYYGSFSQNETAVATYTYKINCVGKLYNDPLSDSVTVEVREENPNISVTLKAVKTVKVYDLVWEAKNSVYCAVIQGAPDFEIEPNEYQSGSDDIYPYVTTTYTIGCNNAAGESDTATIIVDPL